MAGYEEKFLNGRILAQDAAYNMRQAYQGSYSQRFEPFSYGNNSYKQERAELKETSGDLSESKFAEKKCQFPHLIETIKEYHKNLLQVNPPQLSKRAEEQLTRNYRQTIVAEGNLQAAVPNAKSFLITSSFPKEGKTTGSIFLAHSLAVFSGRKVLLIDTNFRAPKIHLFFNITIPCSLIDVIANLNEVTKNILPTKYNDLFILPYSVSISTIGTINKKQIKNFLNSLEECFDYIIFDGGSILSASEVVMFAQSVDAVIFVVECEKTKWEVLQNAIDKVLNVSGKLGGIILNKRKYYLPKWLYRII